MELKNDKSPVLLELVVVLFLMDFVTLGQDLLTARDVFCSIVEVKTFGLSYTFRQFV